MRLQFRDILIALLKTLAVLMVMEITSTTIFPLLGMQNIRVPFNILIILFLGFKLETPLLGFLIVIIQYFHSFFTVEGWEIGTIAGIIVCVVVAYLKDMIHLTNFVVTVLVTELFQVLWFFITSTLIYLSLNNFQIVITRFWKFIPESIVVSIAAPFFFVLLDKIWSIRERGTLGDS